MQQIPEWLKTEPTIPMAMLNAKRWLVHRNKQPFYVDGSARRGELDTPEDTSRLGSYEDALELVKTGFDGLGFALGDGWQGIDLDKIDQNNLHELADSLPGYVERSPSGLGLHAIGFGQSFDPIKKSGVECYSGKRFFTVTGNAVRGDVSDLSGFVEQVIHPVYGRLVSPPADQKANHPFEPVYWDLVESAVNTIDPSCSRDEWIKIGFALNHAAAQSGEAERPFILWRDWSAKSDKYPGDREIAAQWRSFDPTKVSKVTLGTLFDIAGGYGWIRPQVDVSRLFDRNESEVHPLARVRPLNTKPQPVNWLIPGVIQQGLVVIAGSAGVGKTTNLLPMLLSVAHLCPDDSPVRPPAKRKIVWITEDPNQVERIVSGMVMDGYFTQEEAEGWLNVVDARRMPIDELVAVEPEYRKWWVTAGGSKGPVVMRPLVVFDTMNAVIDVDDENANSSIGKVFAAIKASFPDYPVVVIAHLAKALKGRKDANELAVRGAGAIEADAHQIMYLVQEDSGDRYLIFGKTRFERKRGFDEIKFISHAKSVILDGTFGPEETILRWSEAQPVEADERTISRAEARKTEREESAREKQKGLIDEMVQVVKQHNEDGETINRTMLYRIIGGNAQAKCNALNRAMALRKITEFTADSGKRALYALTKHETVEAIVGGCVIAATAEGVDRVNSIASQ